MHGLMLGLPLAALSVCGPAPPVWPARFVLAQRKVPDDRSGNSTVRRDPPSSPEDTVMRIHILFSRGRGL